MVLAERGGVAGGPGAGSSRVPAACFASPSAGRRGCAAGRCRRRGTGHRLRQPARRRRQHPPVGHPARKSQRRPAQLMTGRGERPFRSGSGGVSQAPAAAFTLKWAVKIDSAAHLADSTEKVTEMIERRSNYLRQARSMHRCAATKLTEDTYRHARVPTI